MPTKKIGFLAVGYSSNNAWQKMDHHTGNHDNKQLGNHDNKQRNQLSNHGNKQNQRQATKSVHVATEIYDEC